MSGMPDTPPPTPIRDDYFPPPPVDLADDSFALPDVPNKPLIPPKPVLDTFSRPLTKIIDSKKNKIQTIPKKIKSDDIDDVNCQNNSLNFFLKLIKQLKKK